MTKSIISLKMASMTLQTRIVHHEVNAKFCPKNTLFLNRWLNNFRRVMRLKKGRKPNNIILMVKPGMVEEHTVFDDKYIPAT